MVQAEVEGALVEWRVELLEGSGVPRKGLVEQGQSVQGSWSSSEGHSSDLTLDVQFQSATKFDHQGPGVHVSGIRG